MGAPRYGYTYLNHVEDYVVVNSWIFLSEARKNHELTKATKDSDWSVTF